MSMPMPLLEIKNKKKVILKKSQISQNLIHLKQLAHTLQLKYIHPHVHIKKITWKAFPLDVINLCIN